MILDVLRKGVIRLGRLWGKRSHQAGGCNLSARLHSPSGVSVLIVLASSSVAFSQSAGPTASGSDAGLRTLLMLGVENLGRLRCTPNRLCAPVTPEERANPPLTVEEARAIVRRGVISGAAAHCGLDWGKRNFEPMMAYWRNAKRKTERQMALVGFLHGAAQGMGGKMLAGDACSDVARRNMDAQLAFRP